MSMTDDEIVALLNDFSQASYGYSDGTLQNERAQAIARYNTELYGNEVDGRSQVVSSVLRDAVETLKPQLMRIFLSGDEVCKFDPTGREDEAGAKQETEYINFVITQRNDAYQLFSTWFTDALLCKNGYVKASWEKRSDILIERYAGLPDDAFQLLLADKSVTPTEHTEYPDPFAQGAAMTAPPNVQQPQQMPMLHDVVVKRVKETGKVRIDNIPAEEIRVHRSTRDVNLTDAISVEHQTPKTLSEVRQMGYDVPDDWAGIQKSSTDMEPLARDRFNEVSESQRGTESTDPATQMVLFREIYARVDVDGDGIAELRRFCLVNDHLLAKDETDLIPVACITPIIQPHRHIGYGYYDLLKSIEESSTAVIRAYMDDLFLATRGRYGVDVTKVNIDDMLVSKPGGLVRTQGNPAEGIMPLPHPQAGQVALEGLSFLTNWKKDSTGVALDSEALSPDVLNSTTATAIDQVVSASQAKPEAIARTFAETGVRELFRIVHHLILQNATSEERAKINQQWVTVDPREWQKRTSLTVTVGLGTGSKTAKIGYLTQLAQMQVQGMQIGIAQPPNLYETAAELTKEMGYKDAQRFWTDPRMSPPQQKPPDPIVQAEQVKAQATLQSTQMKAQADSEKMQQQSQLDQQKMVIEQAMAERDAQRQLELEKWKAELQAETQIKIEAMKESLIHERESQRVANEGKPQVQIGSDQSTAALTEAAQHLKGQGDAMGQGLAMLAQALSEMRDAYNRPKRAIRGAGGRIEGIQ